MPPSINKTDGSYHNMTEQVRIKNSLALQSVQLPVTSTSASETFTVPLTDTNPSFEITNTSTTTGVYVAFGLTTATALASTTTPSPSSGDAVSASRYLGPGMMVTWGAPVGSDTIAAITASGTATLEISLVLGS